MVSPRRTSCRRSRIRPARHPGPSAGRPRSITGAGRRRRSWSACASAADARRVGARWRAVRRSMFGCPPHATPGATLSPRSPQLPAQFHAPCGIRRRRPAPKGDNPMKRPIVPLLVLLLVLVLGAGPRLARPPAATAQTGTVTFYSGIFFNQPPDCTNLCGGIVQPFTSSQATLAGWGIAGHIASLKLAGVPAIAVYTGENFSGTCETIIEDQAALRGHTVGENQIASFKLNATCDGPLAPGLNPVPFVSDVIVKAQPQGTRFSTCPSSYTWRATDLNLGIDNVPEVTLCLHFTGDPAKDPYIPALRRGVTATDGVTCNNTVGFDEGVPGGQAIVLCRANPALTPSALTLDLRTAVVTR